MEIIHWNNYLAAFFAGSFFMNAIPHLVQGLSGNYFPTPFAKPPGKGLSSPLTNTLWAFANLLIGFLLFKASKVSSDFNLLLLIFFAGMIAISIFSAINFANKAEKQS
ncbi:hypothetical protein [Microbacter margulisiae]|uniref:Uncharacterized protein n=1 Tax=Microbacter margulisiae TaxID=1350067 RepID=A0A7W5DR00_9PORP|nr:hypothetical protein [Microbacter margulisiae]MBB3187482.1 hypothetical protein [Microbacter margulisiae]